MRISTSAECGLVVLAAVVGLVAIAPEANACELRWQPVGASGFHTIVDNTGDPGTPSVIGLPEGGVTVELELQVSGWRYYPGTPPLGAYQGTVDSTSYSTGAGDPLVPLGWPGSPEDGCYIDVDRPDFVFFDLTPVAAVDVTTLNYELGSTSLGGFPADDGTRTYGGTVILEVPAGAAGDYTVTLLADWNKTFMFFPLEDPPGPFWLRTAAIISVGDCQANGIADVDDIAGGTSVDCNGDLIPDECQPELDYDGDGVLDPCDPCPLDNPDDTDGDGACDSDDVCPGLDDFADADGDTVPDCLDQCPGDDDSVDANHDGIPDCLQSIPTTSQWGLIVLALLLLAAGKVYFGTRPQRAADAG